MVKLRMSSWSLNDISCVFTSTQPSTGNEHRAGYTVKPITVYIPMYNFDALDLVELLRMSQNVNITCDQVM